jgi:hypothetical protein
VFVKIRLTVLHNALNRISSASWYAEMTTRREDMKIFVWLVTADVGLLSDKSTVD